MDGLRRLGALDRDRVASTYNTAPVAADGTLRVGQGAIYLTRSKRRQSGNRQRLAPRRLGHQFFPDINADGGRLFALWHDSRNDPGYSVQNPPGNDTRRTPQGSHLADRRPGDLRRVDLVTAARPGRRSGSRQGPRPELRDVRRPRVPFHGDYDYVSSVDGFAYGTWTDTRQVVGGDDPRYAGGEGFDVLSAAQRQPARRMFGLAGGPTGWRPRRGTQRRFYYSVASLRLGRLASPASSYRPRRQPLLRAGAEGCR